MEERITETENLIISSCVTCCDLKTLIKPINLFIKSPLKLNGLNKTKNQSGSTGYIVVSQLVAKSNGII